MRQLSGFTAPPRSRESAAGQGAAGRVGVDVSRRLGIVASCWVVSLAVAGCGRDAPAVSGVVEAPRVTLSAELAGRVTEVLVREGQQVEAGSVLATIDCRGAVAQRDQAAAAVSGGEAQLRLAQAREQLVLDGARPQERDAAAAEVAAAEQALAMAQAGATADQRAQLEAGLAGVRARKELAELSLERAQALSTAGTSPAAQRDAAQTELAALTAEEQRLLAALAEAEGARPEEIAILRERTRQARARLDAVNEGARVPERSSAEAAVAAASADLERARAALEGADVQVGRCQVLAPTAGTIDIVAYDPGEVVSAGSPMFALAPDEPLEVRAWASQVDLSTLGVGDAVLVTPDVGGSAAAVRGVVRHVEERPEFTAGNVQTPNDRMLLVYRLDIDLPAEAPGFRPGMTVLVDLRPMASP